MSNDATAPTPKLSPVEAIKESSRYLRGTLADVLTGPEDHFGDADKNLLKFHGSYQQEDRDARKNRSKAGVGKHYMFMVRCKIPGGKMSAGQYLALDALTDRTANGTLRVTTRQSIQFHGILKTHLKENIAGINACLLSTLGACGDVNRNVMACPAPTGDPVRLAMQELADAIAAHLAPRTTAYHDIWLNGHRVTADSEAETIEPIYGKVYLPRKFKIGLTRPDDNCIDVYAQDLGFLAAVEDGQLAGFDVLVGGGMGRTNGNANTFAHLGQAMCFVRPDQVVAAAEAVVKLFRDHGNRGDRKRARIKYVVHDWGLDKFRQVLAEYLPFPLVLPREVRVTGFDLHLGWHPQADGKWFRGVSIENGRIKDEGDFRLKTGLRAVVERFQPAVRLTAQQDLLLCDVAEADKAEVDRMLAAHGVPAPEQLSAALKYSMACPAIPTCGLAITESERALPGVIDELESALQSLGLADQPLGVRMTGCPNGCARPYNTDVGLVGRSGDKYTVYVGGSTLGTRLSFELQDLVPRARIVPMLKVLLERYRQERSPGEGFGDYCARLGPDAVRGLVTSATAAS